ncbi:class I SAM-dependent methyltransferase, partial [bacterium]
MPSTNQGPVRVSGDPAHPGELVARSGEVDVVACTVCGYRHLLPLPDPAALREFYTDTFYEDFHKDYIESQAKDLDWWRLEFGAKYALFARELPTGRRRLLDVGSGAGWFLQYGTQQGWQTVGVEPGRLANEHARHELGQTVIDGLFEPAVLAGQEAFDVVHFNNVLEHVPDPGTLLQTAHGALSTGGLISVTVPNDFNPLQQALVDLKGHAPWWVAPQEHVCYFNRADLEALLRRHGFTPQHSLASFPLEMFALMGEDYIADPDLGAVVHGKRMAFEQNMHRAGRGELLLAMYEKLGEIGI